MATSDEHDETSDKAEEHAAEKEAAHEEPAAASKADEAEEEAPPPKPAPKAAPKRPAARPVKRPAPPPKGGSLGKSMILFVIIIGGLVAGFAILGREEPGQNGPAKPKWKTGDSVEVELTLVKTDAKDLSCGSAEEIAGKHCAFEGQNKPWSKGPSTDEKTVFKPYTTTDRVQFVAAGLWSDPNLAAASLPPNRFSVKCKYKVEGNLKKVDVRWAPDGQWFPNTDWYAGTIESCGKPVPQQ